MHNIMDDNNAVFGVYVCVCMYTCVSHVYVHMCISL